MGLNILSVERFFGDEGAKYTYSKFVCFSYFRQRQLWLIVSGELVLGVIVEQYDLAQIESLQSRES